MVHAEVCQVWPKDGRIRVVGELAGADLAERRRWRLVLTAAPAGTGRGRVRRVASRLLRGPSERTYRARIRDGRFEAVVPARHLTGHRGWELHLRGGDVTARLGRHLDDIADKHEIFLFPVQKVRPTLRMAAFPPGRDVRRRVRIKIGYTADNHLVIG